MTVDLMHHKTMTIPSNTKRKRAECLGVNCAAFSQVICCRSALSQLIRSTEDMSDMYDKGRGQAGREILNDGPGTLVGQ
jgi:hypothetical protein